MSHIRFNLWKIILALFFLAIYGPLYAATQEDVIKFFAKNKIGSSPDYAFVKNGIAGKEYLLTIYGYANDKAVCESLAHQYNSDPSLSVVNGTYECIQLNK